MVRFVSSAYQTPGEPGLESGAGSRKARTVHWIAITALLGMLLVVSAPLGSHGQTTPSVPFGLALVASCNPHSPSPSAVNIPLPGPGISIPAGGSVSVAYEVSIQNYTPANQNTSVYVPSAVALFPLGSGGSLRITILSKVLHVVTSGWTNSASTQVTKKLSSPTSLGSGSVTLSTQKIAVMAPSVYGTLSLAFRWQWTVHNSSTGPAWTSGWTIPSRSASAPNLPSIFYPAPYVGLSGTSPNPAPAGSNFTLRLTGAVSNTSFRMVLEYPSNGTEIQSIWESSPLLTTQFNGTVPLSTRTGAPVAAGNYLVHVHDVCQALIRSLTLSVTVTKVSGGLSGPPTQTAAVGPRASAPGANTPGGVSSLVVTGGPIPTGLSPRTYDIHGE